jgi:lactate permease
MYRQVLDPVAHSIVWSALVAALPLVVLFVLLGVIRVTAWIASLASLLVALLVATLVYPMPVGQALLAGSEGAAYGFFPILWIVINAIWVYQMTVVSGHFDVLRRSFARVSDDQRVQAIIIAFCFGALIEGLAGFGTPVAITAAMLVAVGLSPMRAAAAALLANTAPVAFGALATPIITLAGPASANLPLQDVGSMVGRQTPVLSIFVPLALVALLDGWRGVRERWLIALTAGVAFGLAQFVTSNYISIPLADIVAALFSAAVTVGVVRLLPSMHGVAVRPAPTYRPVAGGAVDEPSPEFMSRVERPLNRAEIIRAYAPYLVIVLVFVLAQWSVIKDALDSVTRTFSWPGLHIERPNGKPSTLPTFRLNWLGATGTLILIAGLITIPILGLSPAAAVRAYGRTLRQLGWAILTVMAVLALAYVMNASAMTTTLGTWMAGAGSLFAILSPILGWLGVAVTGSDTSSNALFGALQVTAANKAGLDPLLMAGSNSSGGVLGKMISPQNLAIAAATVGLAGREGDLFRRVFLWSLILLAGMCLLVGLQSTSVLSWMIP